MLIISGIRFLVLSSGTTVLLDEYFMKLDSGFVSDGPRKPYQVAQQ